MTLYSIDGQYGETSFGYWRRWTDSERNQVMSDLSLANFYKELVGRRPRVTQRAELDNRQKRILDFSSRLTRETDRLCDIGCKDGLILERLSGSEKVGVDFLTSQFQEARKRGVTPFECNIDGEALPFEDDCFDVVTCFDTLEHCIRTDHIINEINRVLKPGGMFIASVPNTNHPGILVFSLLDYAPPSASRYRCSHYRDFTNTTFRNILKIHGFEILKNEGSFIGPFWNRISIRAARWVPRLGETLMFAGRKISRRSIPDGYIRGRRELIEFFAREMAERRLESRSD